MAELDGSGWFRVWLDAGTVSVTVQAASKDDAIPKAQTKLRDELDAMLNLGTYVVLEWSDPDGD